MNYSAQDSILKESKIFWIMKYAFINFGWIIFCWND
jgi:hypothetical protein